MVDDGRARLADICGHEALLAGEPSPGIFCPPSGNFRPRAVIRMVWQSAILMAAMERVTDVRCHVHTVQYIDKTPR